MEENTKYKLQDSQYSFPYHYLPSLDKKSVFRPYPKMSWGLKYITYISFMTELIFALKPKSLIDIGCGDGRLIQIVKKSVPSITGIDLSKRAVAFAKAFNPEIEILCGDITELSQKYEMVTLVEVLEHIPEDKLEVFMRDVARLVLGEGYLLITVPTINVPLIKKHYRHYDLKMLENCIKPYFIIDKSWWLYRKGIPEKIIRFLIYNKFYILNFYPLLRILWNLHKKITYFADAETGENLVCLARPKNYINL